jgi:hypothetical protein
MVTVFVSVFHWPVTVTVALLVTAEVVMEKVLLELPAGTVTEAGSFTAALLLDRYTTTVAEPAGPVRVTVPVEGLPPTRLAGLAEIAENAAGFTVMDCVLLTLP